MARSISAISIFSKFSDAVSAVVVANVLYEKKCVFEIQENCPITLLQGTGEKAMLWAQ